MDFQLLTADSPAVLLRSGAGAKAWSLHQITREGITVPEWTAIGTAAFDHFIRSLVPATGRAVLSREPNAENYRELAAEAHAIITGTPLDEPLTRLVATAYAPFDGAAVAVRSSGVEEDSADLSFAGQFETILNVRGGDDVIDAVKRCWASAYSERSLLYRIQHRRDTSSIAMGVIVQRLVPAERSGVLFTADAVASRRDEMMISSAFGLGEGLVSGEIDADNIVIDKETGEIRASIVGEKESRLDPAADGGCRCSPVDEEQRRSLSLTPDEIAELHQVGSALEQLFGTPQDIEWALDGQRLWILQSRPITSLRPMHETAWPADGPRLLWDNSNIIESFGDLTGPLTFTFAQHVYYRVHLEYCRTLGFREATLREMDQWQRNRLGQFNGRVYYNLLNWYRLQRILPLSGLKRQVMELSMGVEKSIDPALLDTLRPFKYKSAGHELMTRSVVGAASAWQFASNRRRVLRFLRDFDQVAAELENLDYDRINGIEAYARFLELELKLLPKWGGMAGLENVILTSFGILLALTRRWLPDAPGWFYWKISNPGGGVESAEAAHLVSAAVSALRAQPGAAEVVASAEPHLIYDRLAAGGFTEIIRPAEEYAEKFQYRTADELKLEAPVADQTDLSAFFLVVRAALATDAAPRPEADGSKDPDVYLREHLEGPRRAVYTALRQKVQVSLDLRERVRLRRTRVFGLVRKMFLAMGRDLARAGALGEPRDIFYLRLEEVRGCFEGTISNRELRPLVQLRKTQERENSGWEAPHRFETVGLPYWDGNLERAGWRRESAGPVAPSGEPVRELRGVPCGPGVGEGEAQVLQSPTASGRGVLVAYRTDPSWVSILPLASALLIERGSPLTHVAIVARELGVPTVVQLPGLTATVKTGMRLRVDGSAGTVHVLDGSGR